MTVNNVEVLPKPLGKLVEKIAKKNGFSDYRLHVKTIDTDGDNYLSYLYVIDIEEDGKELNLFGKVTNTPENARVQFNPNDVFKREVFCYTELADAFEALQSKHEIPEERRYRFAKYYASNLNELEEIMVLENLSKKGYMTHDRIKSIDWDYAKIALDRLATFHALSFALEREDPELFDKLIRSKKETLITESKEKRGETGDLYFKGLAEMVFNAVETKYIPALQNFMETLQNGYFEQQYAPTERSVLAHGDYRVSNLMVKYEEGKPTDLLPLDYQLIYHGSPINDVLYLLVTSTDETFRRQHYERFLQHYHDSLGRALAALSHDVDEVYPRSLFYAHLRDRLLYCLSLAMFTLPMVLVTPGEQIRVEDMTKIEPGKVTIPPVNKIYRERLMGILRDLDRWGALTA